MENKKKMYYMLLLTSPYLLEGMTRDGLLEACEHLGVDHNGSKDGMLAALQWYSDELRVEFETFAKSREEFMNTNSASRFYEEVMKVYDSLNLSADASETFVVTKTVHEDMLLAAFSAGIILSLPARRFDLLPEITGILDHFKTAMEKAHAAGSKLFEKGEHGDMFVHTDRFVKGVNIWVFLYEFIRKMPVFESRRVNMHGENFKDAIQKDSNMRNGYLKDSNNVLDPEVIIALTREVFEYNFKLKTTMESMTNQVSTQSTVQEKFLAAKYKEEKLEE